MRLYDGQLYYLDAIARLDSLLSDLVGDMHADAAILLGFVVAHEHPWLGAGPL